MQNPFISRVGGVLSADIAVPQHEDVIRFYSRVLTTGDKPLWREDLTNNRGIPVIGLGARSPEYETLPLQWMPHIQVESIAGSVERALGLGGTEILHGRDEDGNSQWAVLTDPDGAAFGLVLVVSEDEIPKAEASAEKTGHITWLSLTVPDAPSICEFYQSVVGWTAVPADSKGVFEMRRPDGMAAAEICPVNKGNENIPAVWILSLPVGDFNESLKEVQEGGGEVVKEVKGTGFAVIKDPAGVYIALQADR